ncbi:MAG: mechanosensitive ion channel domain-containing protein [Candidatus Altiarchaeota archaeon]
MALTVNLPFGFDFTIDYVRIAAAVLVVAASIVAAKIINYVIKRYVVKLTQRTSFTFDDEIIAVLSTPVYYFIILLGVYVAVGFVLITPATGPIQSLISAIVIILLAWVVAGFASLLISKFGGRMTKLTDTSIDDEALPFISKVAKIIIYGIAFSMMLEKLGYSIGPILASLGLAGFAIGFAAKDTISNILAGFFILVDRPFKIGDRVDVGGTIGDVVDIGLRTTKLKTLDFQIVIVPNSSIVSSNVTNYSLPNINQKIKLNFGVSYGSDIEKAKKITVDVANKTKLVLPDPPPEAFFLEFGESSLNFTLVIWIEDLRKKWTVTDAINTQVRKRFQDEGIEVPFPVRTVILSKEK